MALLTLQLSDLETMSTADPANPGSFDPANITAMRDLRRKIRSTIIYFARQIGAGATFVIEGRPNFPDGEGGSAEPQEAIGWAQRVLASPDSMLDAAFRVALYNDIDGPGTTQALIFALGTTHTTQIDTGIRNAMMRLLPLLTKGQAPGR